jgi:PAS domain S-box-containing protein
MDANNGTKGFNLKLLVLEDSRHDFELVKEQLIDAGYVLDLTHVDRESDFIASLKDDKFDIILSDFNLPGFNAFEALRIANDICPEVPFVCISGSIGEEIATDLLKHGAVDYVLKDRPDRLPYAVKRALDEAFEKQAYRKAVKALQESENRFKQVAENAKEWIWEVDIKGLFTYSSPVVKSLLGYTDEEIVGKKHFYDFYLPEELDKLKIEVFKVLSVGGIISNFENKNVHKDGHVLMMTTTGSPTYDNNGNIIGYCGVNTDITERTKMMSELVQAKEKAEESDKLKTAFINNISHEIRTPLNGIIGFGQFLAEENLTKEERLGYFNLIQKSSNRLVNTVSDYIDIARIVSGTMEVNNKEFDLIQFFDIISQKTHNICEEKNIDFKVFTPMINGKLMLNSDAEIIDKVLYILLENAIKFTNHGCISCGFNVLNGFIDFYVKDTGRGIAKNQLEKIFIMFSQEDTSNTRGYEGSGLGLTIARGLVQLLGGTISVVSEKGVGSTFSFTVPYKASGLKSNLLSSDKSSLKNSLKPLILIVEDDDLNFLYIEAVIKMINCDYLHAKNGVEAVDMCKQNDQITLVLMDIKMPVMNGVEATQIIHLFRPELPIIATTAYAQTGDEFRFISAGCNGYITKPIKREKLIELVDKYIPNTLLANEPC